LNLALSKQKLLPARFTGLVAAAQPIWGASRHIAQPRGCDHDKL
jgi:hypothetical protein